MNNGNTRFGNMLRQWRAITGRSLRDVAAEIGINHTTLQRIENGKDFDMETWLRIQGWLFERAFQSRGINEQTGSKN